MCWTRSETCNRCGATEQLLLGPINSWEESYGIMLPMLSTHPFLGPCFSPMFLDTNKTHDMGSCIVTFHPARGFVRCVFEYIYIYYIYNI